MKNMKFVRTLAALATNTIVKECWMNSGAVETLAAFYHSAATDKLSYGTKTQVSLAPYCIILNEIVRQILQLELPVPLINDVGNCFLEFEREVRHFASFVVTTLYPAPREYFDHCLQSIVVTPSGKIDRQETIINIVLGSPTLTYVSPKYTAFFCVELERVKKIVREQQSKNYPSFYLETIFPGPEWYWWQRNLRDGPEMSLFLYSASRGPVEAMEHFFPRLAADVKDEELSRVAAHLVLRRAIDVDYLWFLYTTMKPSTWYLFVRRNFYIVMVTLLLSHRYRKLAVHFYGELRDKIDVDSIGSVLEYISERCVVNVESQPGGTYGVDLMMNELEPIFLSIWRMMPSSVRRHVANHVKLFINRFLHKNRFQIVCSLIEFESFNKHEQLGLVHHVVMTLIVTNKQSYIDEFLSTLSKKPHLDRQSIKNGYLTYYTLRQFIVSGDSCQNIDNYNTLLRTKHTEGEITRIKQRLLNDELFLDKAAEAIKYRMFTVKTFYQLISWCCSDDCLLLYKFVADSLNVLAKVYKNHLLFTKTSIQIHNPFYLTEGHMQKIRKYITRDPDALNAHCMELMATKKYSAISTMLSCVFNNDEDRVAFLREFFRSPNGYNAVNRLLSQNVFDDGLHYEYEFDKKIAGFIEFKKHWVLTPGIVRDIELILDAYVIPDMDNEREEHDLLPHERLESFQKVCEEDWESVQMLLRLSEEEFRRFIYNHEEEREEAIEV